MGLELDPLGLDHLFEAGPAGGAHRGVGEEDLEHPAVHLRGHRDRQQPDSRVDHEMVLHGVQRPVDDPQPLRLPLGGVGVQQRRAGLALEHGRQLPGQVLRVLHTGVHAQSRGRRVAVHRVADQEDPALRVLVGDRTLHRPVADAQDLHRHVADPQQFPDLGRDRLLVEVGVVGGQEREMEGPLLGVLAPRRAHLHHVAAGRVRPGLRIDEMRDQHIVFPPRGQIRLQVRGDDVEQVVGADHRGADHLADGLAAVGADEVIGGDGEGFARRAIADRRGDRVVALAHLGQLVMEQNPSRRTLLGVLTHDGFQAQLRIVGRPARTVAQVLLGERATAETVHLVEGLALQRSVPGEGGLPDHRGHLLRRRAHGVDVVGDLELTEQLHRPLIQVVRLRQDRRALVTFDEDVVDSVTRQHDRGHQTGGAAADDQYGDLGIGHGWLPLSKIVDHECAAARLSASCSKTSSASGLRTAPSETTVARGAPVRRRLTGTSSFLPVRL